MKKIIVDSFIIPKYNKNRKFIRPVYSFKCRNRSLKQKNIFFLKKHWKYFGINFNTFFLDINKFFHQKNTPLILDVGFGTGESLVYTANKFIQCNILGIEVYLTGIINTIKKIYYSVFKINNIKIIPHDVVEVLQYMIQDDSVSLVQFFFPDPWPKFKHHKRRLLTKNFFNIILKKIIIGGLIHIITDCILYYNSIIKIMKDFTCFIDISKHYKNIIVDYKKITKFAKKSQYQDYNIFNLVFQCIK